MRKTAAQSGKTGRKIVEKSESNLVTQSVHLPYFFEWMPPSKIVAAESGALSKINTLE